MKSHPLLPASLVVLCSLSLPGAATSAQALLKTETFDRDPRWEGHNNRIVPKDPLTIKQDFGYSATNIAGKAKGELGGRIQRSTTMASYAVPLAPAKTLNDELSASGTFAIKMSQPGAGVFFGFFNSDQPGGSGRPIGSFGLNMDFEAKGGRLAVRLITGGNKSCGTFVTPYLPGKYRTTPLKNDGTHYQWKMEYNPDGAGGLGQFTFTMSSDNHPLPVIDPNLPAPSQAEERARFPTTTTFTVNLPPGYKAENATFNRFGMLNMMKSGGVAELFFDDLTWNGQTQEFSRDPEWIGAGNRVTFEERDQLGAHNFGFSEKTNFAGGKPGEVGGGFWRSGDAGYYADQVGPFNLDQRLEARGKVRLVTAGPDSDMSLGWFSSAAKAGKEDADQRNFVGVHVGGPTRIGHYFIPQFATAKGPAGKVDKGPILTPGKTFAWSLVYDPAANGGNGEIQVRLGQDTVTLPLKPGQKALGANLDRFGLFTSTAGGQMVKIYLDDLNYTAGNP